MINVLHEMLISNQGSMWKWSLNENQKACCETWDLFNAKKTHRTINCVSSNEQQHDKEKSACDLLIWMSLMWLWIVKCKSERESFSREKRYTKLEEARKKLQVVRRKKKTNMAINNNNSTSKSQFQTVINNPYAIRQEIQVQMNNPASECVTWCTNSIICFK